MGDLVEKCRWYVANGVEIAVLVLTRRRAVMHFGAGSAEKTLSGADTIDLTAVLPDFQLTVDELFGALRVD